MCVVCLSISLSLFCCTFHHFNLRAWAVNLFRALQACALQFILFHFMPVLSWCARLICKTVAIKHTRSYHKVLQFSFPLFLFLGTHFAFAFSASLIFPYFFQFFAPSMLVIVYLFIQVLRSVPFNNCFFLLALALYQNLSNNKFFHASQTTFAPLPALAQFRKLCCMRAYPHTENTTPNNVALMMGLKSLTDADVECINLNFFHRYATDIWAGCEFVCLSLFVHVNEPNNDNNNNGKTLSCIHEQNSDENPL